MLMVKKHTPLLNQKPYGSPFYYFEEEETTTDTEEKLDSNHEPEADYPFDEEILY